MTIAQLIPLILSTSIFLNVLSLGLQADVGDATYLFRRPILLLRAVLAMNVLMVLVVVAAASIFSLTPPVRIALLALAVSPVPPMLPNKEKKLGASQSYAIGLLVAEVLLAFLFVPWSIEWIGRYFGEDTHVSATNIAPLIFVSTVAPLGIGIIVNRLLPGLARRAARPVFLVSIILLVVGVLPILFTMSGAMWTTIVDGAIVALICFTLIGLAIGHALGGPEPGNRTALALATCCRHPGIALAIASMNYPERKEALMAVILCHLIVSAVICIPYNKWRRRHLGASA